MRLRPYQTDSLKAIIRKMMSGVNKQVVVQPVGTGKTLVMAALPGALKIPAGFQTFYLTHREELIEQTVEKLEAMYPDKIVGVEQGSNECDGETTDIIVASVQTVGLAKEVDGQWIYSDRLTKFGRDRVRVVICDELHHATADNYLNVFRYFRVLKGDPRYDDRSKLLVGFTATPNRADNVGMEKIVDCIAYERTLAEMIDEGWVSQIRAKSIETMADISKVKKSKGDFAIKELEREINTPERNQLVVDKYKELGEGGLFFAFTVDVQHAEDLADKFKENGLDVGVISYRTKKDERRDLIRRARAGDLDGLCSAVALSEGVDVPNAQVALMCRPTQSPVLYCLDHKTEILTSAGWRGVGQVNIGDTVAAPDPKTLVNQWLPVENVIERKLCPCCESLLSLSSARMDVRVTSSHRMIYRTKKNAWRIAPANQLLGIRESFQLPVSSTSDCPDAPLTDDEIKFIGWFLTDGNLNKITNAVSISQSTNHSEYITEIARVLDSCNFKYGVSYQTDSPFGKPAAPRQVFTISKGAPRGRDKDRTGWQRLSSYIDKMFSDELFSLSDRQFSVLLGAMHLGDGSKQGRQSWTQRSYHICCGNERYAERVQAACVTHGWACNIQQGTKNGSPRKYWILHIKNRATSHIGGAGKRDRPTLVDEGPSDETVWCVSNRAGTLISRRNGKVAIVGNCQSLGRLLRPFPSPESMATYKSEGITPKWVKPYSIVLDFVDVCGKHRLNTVASLFGLRPDYKFTKPLVSEELADIKKLEEKANGQDLKLFGSLLELRTAIETIDLLAVPAVPPEVKQYSRLRWVGATAGGYVLHTPDNTSLRLRQDTLGVWQVIQNVSGISTIKAYCKTLEEAFTLADNMIPQSSIGALMAGARWRNDPVTDKQLGWIGRNKPEIRKKFPPDSAGREAYLAFVRKSFNKGQVSDIITREKNSGRRF